MEKKYNWFNRSPRDWTPVEKSDGTFCGLACGAKCTKAAYDKALSDAGKLVLMMGFGWGYTIWENCQWCYNVYKEDVSIGISIHYNRHSTNYTCYFNSNPQFVTTNSNPQLAYQEALELFNTHIESLKNIQKELKGI